MSQSNSHRKAAMRPPDAIQESIYRVAHDLTAGARAMSHLSAWIVEDIAALGIALPEDIESNLALLQNRAERLQSQMNDLLTFARLGTGQTPFNGDWPGLMTAILPAIPNLSRFELTQNLDARPQVQAQDLQQVVEELLSNAVKHHDQANGHITITCQQNPEGITLSVEDDGPGIPDDHIAQACKIMTTLRPRDDVEGSGMGLAICSRVAALYAGSLSIDTGQQGRGCRAALTFAH